MANVKKTLKKIGRQIWELFKSSIPAGLMYFCAGTVLMMLTLKGDMKELKWDNTKLVWTIVCIVVAMAYNALVTYAQGGSAYEMLVSGNMKRVSAADFGEGYKISSHKESKEYRTWKGFACGAFMALTPIITGIIFGCNQAKIDEVLVAILTESEAANVGTFFGIVMIACLLLSGWSLIPFFILNASGASISYFIGCVFGIVPIVVTGVMYIVGAYGRRRKVIREQEIADRAAAAQTSKEKKINYGGLPGTKPKKRR